MKVEEKEQNKNYFSSSEKAYRAKDWFSWSDYLPDLGRFMFVTYRNRRFTGWRRVDSIDNKTIIITFHSDYDPQEHGMIKGWLPY